MRCFIILCIFLLVGSRRIPKPKTKFCANCKYFIADLYNPSEVDMGKCSAFPIENTNYLIDGSDKTSNYVYYYCSVARSFEHLCGKNGTRYFKRRLTKNEIL